MELEILAADLDREDHAQAVIALVDHYSRDPMGDGRPLPAGVRRGLVPGLRAHPTTRCFLARRGGEALGLAVCFLGFNTFSARRLLNVHDLIVAPAARGRGIGRRLMEHVESAARQLGCAALTLEVRGDNLRAQGLYRSLGFQGGAFEPPVPHYAFWRKELDP